MSTGAVGTDDIPEFVGFESSKAFEVLFWPFCDPSKARTRAFELRERHKL